MYSGGESPLRTIYAKISTTNHQTTENHHMALAKVAGHRGWEIVQTYEDTGISGAQGGCCPAGATQSPPPRTAKPRHATGQGEVAKGAGGAVG